MDGWYYLHENGDLIYKVARDGIEADIRESTFAIGLWPLIVSDRACAWSILVESLAAGARRDRVMALADKWDCDDKDAETYAERLGIVLRLESGLWSATSQDAPVGLGNTALDAMADLCKLLGYRPSKMWGHTFSSLLKEAGTVRINT